MNSVVPVIGYLILGIGYLVFTPALDDQNSSQLLKREEVIR